MKQNPKTLHDIKAYWSLFQPCQPPSLLPPPRCLNFPLPQVLSPTILFSNSWKTLLFFPDLHYQKLYGFVNGISLAPPKSLKFKLPRPMPLHEILPMIFCLEKDQLILNTLVRICSSTICWSQNLSWCLDHFGENVFYHVCVHQNKHTILLTTVPNTK